MSPAASISRNHRVLLTLCLLSTAAALPAVGDTWRASLAALPLAAALLLVLSSPRTEIAHDAHDAPTRRRHTRGGQRLVEIEQTVAALDRHVETQRQAISGLAQDLARQLRSAAEHRTRLEQHLTQLEQRQDQELEQLLQAAARRTGHLARVHASIAEHQHEIAQLERTLVTDPTGDP